MRLRPVDLHDALNTSPQPLDFVLPGLLPGMLGTLVAHGGIGKTTLLLQLAISLAAGANLMDGIMALPATPARVVFVAAEESRELLHVRLHGLARRQLAGVEAERLHANLTLLPGLGHDCRLLEQGVATPFIDELVCACQGARLVILDPLSRLHDGDENSASAMTRVAQTLERLARDSGAAVLVAHHMNKSANTWGATDTAGASRGSSALTDAARLQMNLGLRSKDDAALLGGRDKAHHYVRFDITKANYLPPTPGIWLRRQEGGALVAETKRAPQGSSKGRASVKKPGKTGKPDEGVMYV